MATGPFNLLMLNRLDDVLLTLRLAAERKLESAELLQTQYFVAFLTGNENELRWTATAARKSPATEDIISHIEALALARSGQLQAAGRMAVVHVQIAQKTRPVSAETVPRPCRPCFEVSCRQWTSASAAERNSRPATKAHKCAVRRDFAGTEAVKPRKTPICRRTHRPLRSQDQRHVAGYSPFSKTADRVVDCYRRTS